MFESSLEVVSTSSGFKPSFARILLVSSTDKEVCEAPPLGGVGVRCLLDEISGGGGVARPDDDFEILGGGGAPIISTVEDKEYKS